MSIVSVTRLSFIIGRNTSAVSVGTHWCCVKSVTNTGETGEEDLYGIDNTQVRNHPV